MTPKRLFNFFAIAEGFTWTALIATLIAKALFEIPPITLTIVGGTHGAVFLGYGVTAALVGVNQRWKVTQMILGIVLAIIPFATIPFELSQNRKNKLAGDWRKTASDHPSDKTWFDRLFRWFINRTILLVVTLLAVVAAIFATLVSLGPPDSWGK